MAVLENVDFSQAQEQGTFQPVPAGEYKLMVESTEIKPTKAGDNMLGIKLKIVDGQYKDRYIFTNYNLWHSKDETRRISIDQFHTACMALAGKPAISIKDTSELHFKTAIAIVDIDGQYNRIKGWVKPDAAPSPITAQLATATATPPWAKK